MEMNTRIQVEHPVTEFVTGYDLIKSQIEIASGKKLSTKKVKFQGHAIECRINAEDPDHDFRPSPGKITSLHFGGGPGIRIDSHIYSGYQIPPYYDSLVAKLIVHANTRAEAITKIQYALEECIIEGIHTTIPFHQKVMQSEKFRSGVFDTKFIETFDIDD
jgi:acetyl-CoA carboxylase biotin carboxylase subunit